MFGFGRKSPASLLKSQVDNELLLNFSKLPMFSIQTVDKYLEGTAQSLLDMKAQTIERIKEVPPEEIITELILAQKDTLKNINNKVKINPDPNHKSLSGSAAMCGQIGAFIFSRATALKEATNARQTTSCYFYSDFYSLMLKEDEDEFDPNFFEGSSVTLNSFLIRCLEDLGGQLP